MQRRSTASQQTKDERTEVAGAPAPARRSQDAGGGTLPSCVPCTGSTHAAGCTAYHGASWLPAPPRRPLPSVRGAPAGARAPHVRYGGASGQVRRRARAHAFNQIWAGEGALSRGHCWLVGSRSGVGTVGWLAFSRGLPAPLHAGAGNETSHHRARPDLPVPPHRAVLARAWHGRPHLPPPETRTYRVRTWVRAVPQHRGVAATVKRAGQGGKPAVPVGVALFS